jgi:NlpC/P60 family putative phage cell wall peptidase
MVVHVVVSSIEVAIPLMPARERLWRMRVVDITRTWIGTPYHHQASLRGVGTDCFGLVRGVWRELYDLDADPETMPPYSWDWAEARDDETMLAAAKRHMTEVPVGDGQAGDVALFRFKEAYNAKHSVILVGGGKMIHASTGTATCEVHISDWWKRRMAGMFSFPIPVEWNPDVTTAETAHG